MSRKKHRSARRPHRVRRSQPHPTTSGRTKWGWKKPAAWLLVLVAIGIGAVLLLRPRPRPLPVVPLDQLNVEGQRLVEKYLTQVRAAPRSGRAWGELGAMLRSYGFYGAATECFAEAERLDAREPRWPYLQGLLRLRQGSPLAIAKLRRAVALCGNEPDAPRLRLARALAEIGQYTEAAAEYQHLLDTQPHHGLARLGMSRLAQARGDLTNAITLARECLKDGRAAHGASTLLAMLYQRIGDTNAAQEAAHMAATLPPVQELIDPFEAEADLLRDDPRSLSDRAQQFLMAGQTAEAAPLIERLVKAHPHFGETWLLQGRLQVMQKQYAAAEDSLRRHLTLAPPSAGGYFQLGLALLRQQKFPDAAKQFQQALTLKPDFGAADFNWGICLYHMGQKAQAVTPFLEAIRCNPERIDSYILLADLYLQLENKPDALNLFEQARRLNPADPRLKVLEKKLHVGPD